MWNFLELIKHKNVKCNFERVTKLLNILILNITLFLIFSIEIANSIKILDLHSIFTQIPGM